MIEEINEAKKGNDNVQEPNKNNGGKLLLAVIITAAIIFGFIWAKDNLVFNSDVNNNGGGLIESKELQRQDLQIELETGSWTSVYVIVTPRRDIQEIHFTLEYLDSSDAIVKTVPYSAYNLNSGQTYKFEFKNGLLEVLKMKKFQVIDINGKRK